MENLPQQFQTPLSHKQKIFSEFFISLLKCAWKLEHFHRKDEYPGLIISEIIDAERRGYLNVQKSCFLTQFANERGNGFQTPLKSTRHHYYPLFSSIGGKLS